MAGKYLTAATFALFVAAAALGLADPPADTDPRAMHAAAIVLLTVGLWALGTIPEHLSSLLFFLLAVVLAVAPPAAIFAGFAASAFWLVLGGLVIAEAVHRTGLGARIAARLFARYSRSYTALAVAVMVVATLLAFLMPGTLGRMLLLVPIVVAAATGAGLARNGRGALGLLVIAVFGSYQSGAGILPANAPNQVLAGVAEQLYGVHFAYTQWLWLQFPVIVAVKCAVFVWLTCRFFAEPLKGVPAAAKRSAMSPQEKRLGLILLAAIGLWATDFMHGIQGGWVALAAALACLTPRIGVLPPAAFNEIKFSAAIFIAASLGIGAITVATGLADAAGNALLTWLPLAQGADFTNFMSLTTLGTLTGLVATTPAQPALLGPLAGGFAQAAGWSIEQVLMTLAIGVSHVILPYQMPLIVVAMQAAGIPLAIAVRVLLPLAAITLLAINPLDYLWWRLTGFMS